MPLRPTRADVIARRLAAHHLDERVPRDQWAIAASLGLQDSPPSSALLALAARAVGVTADAYDVALAEERSLVRTWSMRGAPFCVPRQDLPVFTSGVLPVTEAARQQLILGVRPALAHVGLSLDEVTTRTRAAATEALKGTRMSIGPLGVAAAAGVEATLNEAQLRAWREEGPYAAGQPYGEAVVHFVLRLLCLEGLVCFAAREGNEAPFVLVDEWLGAARPDQMPPEVARRELVHRYLHCHGPSTPAEFAAWVGVRPRHVGPWWDSIVSETTPVEHGGEAWLLTRDLDRLGAHPMPRGVRLLPPRDPYTQGRDRATLVDAEHHGKIWRTVGEPGTVLAHGEVVGTWRPRARGRRLTVVVDTFTDAADHLSDDILTDLEAAATDLAQLRRATLADLVVT